MLRWMRGRKQTSSAPEATEGGAARQDDWEYLRNRPDFDPEEMATVRRRSSETAKVPSPVWEPSAKQVTPSTQTEAEAERGTAWSAPDVLTSEDLLIGQLLDAALGNEPEEPLEPSASAVPTRDASGARVEPDLLDTLLEHGREIGLLDETAALREPSGVVSQSWMQHRG